MRQHFAPFLPVCFLIAWTTGCGESRVETTEPPASDATERTDGGTPTVESLAGTWVATLSHNGTTEPFELDLSSSPNSDVVRAHISIPAMDLWRYSLGTVAVTEDYVLAGSLRLRHDPEVPRLVGTVPESFVPIHAIALDLRRAESLERPAPRPRLPMPEARWEYETGGPIWAGVCMALDSVFVGSDDGYVVALDSNGEMRWRFATDGFVRAAPVVHGRTVLIHSDDGSLYRVDAESGALVWRARLGADPVRRLAFGAPGFRYDHYGSSPTVYRERVFVGHEREVVALELETGSIVWKTPLPDITTSTPTLTQGNVLVGSFDGNVYALDAASGDTVWTHDTGAPVPSSTVFHDEPALVIVGSRSYDVLALNARDGSRAWTYYNWFSWVESSPTLSGGTLYVGSSDSQQLHAIDAASGRLSWRFDTNGSAWGRPAVSDDTVFIGAVGVAGYLVDHRGGLFAVDRKTGRGLWHVPSPRPDKAPLWGFAASPAVGDGLVVAAGLDGRVVAFDQPSRRESIARRSQGR